MSPVRSRLLLLTAALLFSTGGAAIKAASLNGWQVASFRSAVAAIFFFAFFPAARRAWSWRMLPVSAAYAVTLIAFVVANRLTTSANAIFLQSTAPFYVLLMGPLLLREPIRRGDLVYMLAVGAGMTVFFVGGEPALATAPDPARGNLVALFSGMTYACLLVGLRWLGRARDSSSGIATVALGNSLAFVAALPLALPVREAGLRASAAVILYLGIVQIGAAYLSLTVGIRHVPAVEATTLLMLEPAMNPVFAWLVHGEKPASSKLAGGVVILTATIWNTWRQSRRL